MLTEKEKEITKSLVMREIAHTLGPRLLNSIRNSITSGVGYDACWRRFISECGGDHMLKENLSSFERSMSEVVVRWCKDHGFELDPSAGIEIAGTSDYRY